MTPSGLAVRYLVSRPALNLLTALGIAVGVSLVIAVATLSTSAQKSTQEIAGGYQLLVAAKGSPAQSVLSTLFFMEPPTGNIPTEIYDELRADPGAQVIVPFNFGDSYRGHAIVGTTRDYRSVIEAATGRPPVTNPPNRWAEAPFEAVLGATVARQTGLRVGDTFTALHGFVELPKDLSEDHAHSPYTVVSILEPAHTPADKAIFTTLESIWITHAENPHLMSGSVPARSDKPPHEGTDEHQHEEEATHAIHEEAREADESTRARAAPVRGSRITSLLVHGRSYADVARLVAALGQKESVQAIYPGRVATQIMGYMRTGEAVLLALAWLSIVIACIAVMISLLAASIERRRQIATLRAIGAPRSVIFRVLFIEAGVICILGSVAGAALGRLTARVIAGQIEASSGFNIDLLAIGTTELFTVVAAVCLGLIAGAVPAYLACREDVTKQLAPAS